MDQGSRTTVIFAYLAAFLGVCGHASSEFFVKLSGISGVEVSVWRFGLGGLTLLILCMINATSRNLIKPLKETFYPIVILSIFGIMPTYDYYSNYFGKDNFENLSSVEEIKDRSLTLGLDLQGGIHMVLELDLVDLFLNLINEEYKNDFSDLEKFENNLKNLYNEEVESSDEIELNILSKFLDDNIYKIEKMIKNFIRNIILIIEDDKVLNIGISLKKKNYEKNRINKLY